MTLGLIGDMRVRPDMISLLCGALRPSLALVVVEVEVGCDPDLSRLGLLGLLGL